MMKHAIILFAHGSRDPAWAQPFQRIQRELEARLPHTTVDLAFLENMAPSLPDAVARLVDTGHDKLTVGPVFMAQGAHLKRDLSALLAALRERYPGVQIAELPAFGESRAFTRAVGNWLGVDDL
jgi:sirohydrochlorin cobaltochelatase